MNLVISDERTNQEENFGLLFAFIRNQKRGMELKNRHNIYWTEFYTCSIPHIKQLINWILSSPLQWDGILPIMGYLVLKRKSD